MRTFFIWLFGVVGSGFVGVILGSLADHHPYDSNEIPGFFGGIAVFMCLRLWLARPAAQQPPAA